MATDYTNIERALIQAVLVADTVTPKQMPGTLLTGNDKPDGLWLGIYNIRGQSKPVTLGSEGEDNHPGVFQIDVNYPKDRGVGVVLSKVDELGSFFYAGRTITANGQSVMVRSCSLGPGRYVDGYYRTSLSVYYYARTART